MNNPCNMDRQNDEYFCPRCGIRYGVDEDAPDCPKRSELERLQFDKMRIENTGRITGRESGQWRWINDRISELERELKPSDLDLEYIDSKLGHGGIPRLCDVVAMRDEIERLTERCEAYKSQVEAGAAVIDRLREIEASANRLMRHLVDRRSVSFSDFAAIDLGRALSSVSDSKGPKHDL